MASDFVVTKDRRVLLDGIELPQSMLYETERKDEAMQALENRYPDYNCGARVIQVIETRIVVGKGTEDDPIRPTIVYRAMGGELLAVYDPCFNYGG